MDLRGAAEVKHPSIQEYYGECPWCHHEYTENEERFEKCGRDGFVYYVCYDCAFEKLEKGYQCTH